MADSITTRTDKYSRPVKRRALSPMSKHSASVTALFANPPALPPASETTLAKSTAKPSLAAPPQIVANVQGSSAGAGSGEFHVYKASRRREYERLARMDEESRELAAGEGWERQREEKQRRDEERTERNRTKRRGKGRDKDEKAKGRDKDGKAEGRDKDENTKGEGGDGARGREALKSNAAMVRGDVADGVVGEEGGTGVSVVMEAKGITFADED